MCSRDAAGAIDDVDMVFIDGDHRFAGVMEDIRLWHPKAKKLLCGHDRTQDGVPRALVESGLGIREGPGSLWIADPARPAFTPHTPLADPKASAHIQLEGVR
jgi:hypothetical protein